MSENDHLYHKPDEEAIKKLEAIRRCAISFEQLLDELVPKSRELSTAKTKLEECRMWANKGVVIQCPAEPL